MIFEFVRTYRGLDGKIRDRKHRYKTLAGARRKAETLMSTRSPKIDPDGYAVNRLGDCITPVAPLTLEDLFPWAFRTETQPTTRDGGVKG